MAKKFGGDLIHNLVAQGAEQTSSATTNDSNTESSNTTNSNKSQDNKMRTSYIISKDINLKLKYIALKEGRTISEMVEEAFQAMISNWEKKNGPTPDL